MPPPPPFGRSPSPAPFHFAGRKKKIVLATLLRARALPTTTPKQIRLRKKRGRRSAERRIQPISAQHRQTLPLEGARARKRAKSRGALAFRRFAAVLARTFTSWLSSRPCLLGLVQAAVLPARSGPSAVKAPHASAVVPKRMMPKAAPARTANPRGSTALAPLSKVPSRRRPSMSEILWLVPDLVTDVKGVSLWT
jgi:hypothetical protein